MYIIYDIDIYRNIVVERFPFYHVNNEKREKEKRTSSQISTEKDDVFNGSRCKQS